MSVFHEISSKPLDLDIIKDVLFESKKIKLSQESKKNILKCRAYLDRRMEMENDPIYGINTGFGSLHNVKINKEKLSQLQENLVMSHACGVGDVVPDEIVRLMLFLKIQSLSYGFSGIALHTVERLMEFYNNDVLPVIYTQGSLGASGDLAPLAHLALPLLGKGEVRYRGKIISSKDILAKFNWTPITLQSKEGLALLNGTQFMSAYGIYVLLEAYKLSYFSDLVASISLDAFNGRIEPFQEKVHIIRPHSGQVKTASRIIEFLSGSQILKSEKSHVQDPYSFRCIPQIHGATKDAIKHVHKTFKVEINSVTDNPNIFVEEDQIISGGNFHGQPLALALDYLKISMAELGNVSERRTFQLVSGFRGLPEFLIDNPGLNSGFMIPQYTAASIVSANKQLATPASIDSIVSSNGQEDHVSMGANSATQMLQISKNLKSILAIELLVACQALEFRKPLTSSPLIESLILTFRQHVKFLKDDEILYDLMNCSIQFIDDFCIENNLLFD